MSDDLSDLTSATSARLSPGEGPTSAASPFRGGGGGGGPGDGGHAGGGHAASYRRMGIRDKRAHANALQAEPPVRCPRCETSTPARDLLRHMAERCPGPPPVHPFASWLSMEQATALGVTREMLEHWLRRGLVRVRAAGDELQVLARDLVSLIAMARTLGAA